MLPTFIGIGVPRGGTTWLHSLLDAHPHVTMPQKRKEVHFFDRHFEKGESWYASFFPHDRHAHRYRAVGEITPHYLFHHEVPNRIAAMRSVRQLLLVLRDPVTRAFSHYTWRMRLDNYRKGFDEFLEDYPQAIEWGRYAQPLRRWLDVFRRDQFLILIHEDIFADALSTRRRIAEFIGIDDDRFPSEAGSQRVNTAVIPRFRGAYRLASRGGARLRRTGLDWLPNLIGRRLGLKHLLFGQRREPKPALDDATRDRLQEQFADDIEALETLLEIDLSQWRPPLKPTEETETELR